MPKQIRFDETANVPLLGLRLVREGSLDYAAKPVIHGPDDVAALLRGYMEDLAQERFLVIHIDTKKRVIGVTDAFRGGLDSTPVHPREVFTSALYAGAAAIIIAHNHPSGDPWPSADDLNVTRELRKAGNMLGIELLDHLIIGRNCHLSLRESGLVFGDDEKGKDVA